MFRSGTARRRFLVHAVLVVIALLATSFVVVEWYDFLLVPEKARDFVASFGMVAPLVLIVLQAGQVVVAPIPGQVLAVVAGYLFGAWWGTLYNMIGIAIGSTAAFWLSRHYGRSYVESIVDPDLLERFDAIADQNVLASLFVLFLLPGLPDDVLCFAGGITSVEIRKLVAVAILGRAPAFFLVNLFGDQLGTGDFAGAGLLALAFVLATGLGYVYRDELLETLTGGTSEQPE